MSGPVQKLAATLFVWMALSCNLMAQSKEQPPAPLTVRHAEGLVHGFLLLRNQEGEILATGESTQTARNEQVTSKIVFHFKDGSLHEETVIFSQRHQFKFLNYHLVQKGPAFKHPMEVSVNGVTGDATVQYTEEDGKQKQASERLRLPSNVANGMVPMLLKNLQPGASQLTVALVAATPKPRLVKLIITPAGKEAFSIGAFSREATKYVIKVEIGGVAGVVAPLVGKQPPDTYVWILQGDAPSFLKSEGPLFEGGPIWRVELVSPKWQ